MPASSHTSTALLTAGLLLLGATACGGQDQQDESASPTAPATSTAAPSATAPPTSSSESETVTAEPAPTFDGTLVEVEYADGEVTVAQERVIAPLGGQVRLVVTSDVPDEVHVHGVDEYVDLAPGEAVTRDFTASIPGTFEVELHDAGDLLFTLQVQP